MADVRVSELPRLVGENVLGLLAPGDDSPIKTVDLLDDRGTSPADLFLVVGSLDASAMEAAVERAAARGARALIVDQLGSMNARDLAELSTRRRVGVLERRANTDWIDLLDLVRDQLRATVSTVDPTGAVGDDLAGLADSLAEMLGGPTTIEDAKFRVLSYSTATVPIDRGRDIAILGRRIPEEWLKHLEKIGAIDTLLTTSDVVSVTNGPYGAKRRVLCSIRAERFLLGILWVAEGPDPLPDDIEERMAAAARIATPHLLFHQERVTRRQTDQAHQLRTLLDEGRISLSAAEELGIGGAEAHTLTALRSSEPLPTGIDRSRAVDSLRMYCQSYRWSAAVTTLGNVVYCLLTHVAEMPPARVETFVEGLAIHLQRVLGSRHVIATISDGYPQLAATPVARAQTDDALEVVAPPSGVVAVTSYQEALARVLLTRLARHVDNQQWVYPPLQRLRAEDAATGSEHVHTLRTYLAAGGRVADAARDLQVHVTTVRYRLGRIQEVGRMNLTDPATRLLCEVLLLPAPTVRSSCNDSRSSDTSTNGTSSSAPISPRTSPSTACTWSRRC